MTLATLIRTLAVIACAMLVNAPASAFAVFEYFDGQTLYLKWGDNQAGTPGGVITWSFMPAGTPGSATYCGDACPGTSVDSINIENSPGTGYTLTPLTSLEASITAAMNKWSAVADITFVKLPSDSGVQINDPSAVPSATGHIRIGVFPFASGGGAVGYAPPPNGGTGAGDIIFDANSFYAFQPGDEGDPFPAASTAPNDVEGLLLHELGHAAIGLAHPPIDGNCPVMQVLDFSCSGIINRELDADDIAGARFLYGAADTDGDGVADTDDNCTELANPDQYDSNGDSIGSLCDADITGPGGNEDCTVNFLDLQQVKNAFFSTPASPAWDPDADFDNSGAVNFADLQKLKEQIFGPPGPSADGCN